MPERSVSAKQLRQVFGNIPELTQPVTFPPLGEVLDQWPFKNFRLSGKPGREKACLETALHPGSEFIPNSRVLVRVEYEKSYGLNAKKWMYLQRTGKGKEKKTFLDYGHISYNLGEVEIVLSVGRNSPLVPFQSELEEPSKYQIAVAILSAANPQANPLARTVYDLNSLISIHTQFAYAEYQDALRGLVEKPVQDQWNPPTMLSAYRITYFQWEYLEGAKVGYSQYKNEDGHNILFKKWLTEINHKGLVQLEDTPYQQKISRSRSGFASLSNMMGRLRFSRVNQKTKESWMLSVPDHIADYSKLTLITNFQHTSLMDLLSTYPVVFCVKRPGEERKWFSTFFSLDAHPRLRTSASKT